MKRIRRSNQTETSGGNSQSGNLIPSEMPPDKGSKIHAQKSASGASDASDGIYSNFMVDPIDYENPTYEYLEPVDKYRCNRCKIIYDVSTKGTATHPCNLTQGRKSV
jgi:hypothetical protein